MPVDRTFHDIIDAECVFIELSDEATEDREEEEEETDVADGRYKS